MKKLLCIVFLSFLIILTVGCGNKSRSDEPIYYTDKEIKNYANKAFGSDYEFVNKTSYIDEKNVSAYEYKFQNSNGHSFSIYSRSYYVTKSLTDKYATAFYTKLLKTNYMKTLLDFKANEINNLISSNNFKYQIDNKYNDDIDLIVYFNNENELDKLGNLVYNLYNLIGLKYNETYLHDDMSFNQDAKIGIDGNLYIKCNIFTDSSQNMRNSKYITSFRVPINTVFDEELTLERVNSNLKHWYNAWK